jgi:hypothetical protein
MGKANQEAVARITWDKAADELMKYYQALNSNA